jgi:pimeloyl-ACP methyl ester carboxylesterase
MPAPGPRQSKRDMGIRVNRRGYRHSAGLVAHLTTHRHGGLTRRRSADGKVIGCADLPPGDGHPVLVVPGLGADDDYLEPMRFWLRRLGYGAICSGLAVNPGWSEGAVLHLGEVASDEFEHRGQRVTIIGHSLGGVLARSVAIRWPSIVDHVITLGSPIGALNIEMPANVRMSAIYSRADSIVRYPQAIAPELHSRNIEVTGTHNGLAMNRSVYRHLRELLVNPV